MRGLGKLALVGLALIASGCCSCPDVSEAKAPDPVPEPAAEVADEPTTAEPAESEPASTPQGIAVGEPNPSTPAESEEKPKEAPPEPKFTPGMSVDEAIAAVPKGWEYIGIEPDVLGAPIQDLKLYEPCKLTPSQHFQLRVAIWDGKPVGIDVKSANKKLASCIKDQVAQVTWRNKVKAINTVDYSY